MLKVTLRRGAARMHLLRRRTPRMVPRDVRAVRRAAGTGQARTDLNGIQRPSRWLRLAGRYQVQHAGRLSIFERPGSLPDSQCQLACMACRDRHIDCNRTDCDPIASLVVSERPVPRDGGSVGPSFALRDSRLLLVAANRPG